MAIHLTEFLAHLDINRFRLHLDDTLWPIYTAHRHWALATFVQRRVIGENGTR
jgi:hypothetical protein